MFQWRIRAGLIFRISMKQLWRIVMCRYIVEGIKTQADYVLAAELGCNEIQGYFIAQPMSADEFTGWLANYEKA